MKKVSSLMFLFVIFLFLTPIHVYANEVGNDDNVPIKFEEIENEILEHNPAVLINQNAIKSMEEDDDLNEDMQDDIEDDKDDLNDAIDAMELQIGKLEQDKASLESKIDGDSELINHIKLNYDALIGIYEYSKSSLISSRKTLREQLTSLEDQEEDLEDSIDKLRVQSKMSDYQLVWTAQSLFINYNILLKKETDLTNKMELMEKQLEIAKVKESLGKITKTDITSLELQISELTMSLNDLQTQKKAVLGQFNLLLGNSYDYNLILDTELKPVYENFNELNYNADLEVVLESNYEVTLQNLERETKHRLLNRAEGSDRLSEDAAEYNLDSEEIKLDEKKRDVSFSFHKVYEEVISKEKSYEQEKKKLELEGTKRDYAIMRFDLGKISKLELDSENNNYQSQELNTSVAEQELIQAYFKYDWMKRGLTL